MVTQESMFKHYIQELEVRLYSLYRFDVSRVCVSEVVNRFCIQKGEIEKMKSENEAIRALQVILRQLQQTSPLLLSSKNVEDSGEPNHQNQYVHST